MLSCHTTLALVPHETDVKRLQMGYEKRQRRPQHGSAGSEAPSSNSIHGTRDSVSAFTDSRARLMFCLWHSHTVVVRGRFVLYNQDMLLVQVVSTPHEGRRYVLHSWTCHLACFSWIDPASQDQKVVGVWHGP